MKPIRSDFAPPSLQRTLARAGTLAWLLAESAVKGKPSALGAISGAVAGLVGITPASGWVFPGAALVIGLVLPFDRLLDMTRTVPSASANLTVATLVARGEGALDAARFRGPVAE